MENNNSNSFRELSTGVILADGKYVIECMIGAGGFGITYKARQTGLNRTVAVKEFFMDGYCIRHTQAKTVILQSMKEDTFEKYRQKFVDEARTLAHLKHQGIVEVIEIFDENNTSYMVMPFVEGQTLQKLVETQKPLDYALTVNYLSQIASALGYIHSKNILHRDIKPDNIIITPDYHAVLIDFGSAREFVHDRTQAHTSMLTQGYAPMEQYDTVSRKGAYTDIYALGAVFYFALTGQKPLEATTRTMENMPEPKTLNPKISENVNRTILKAMEMKPANRYQSIDAFMNDMMERQPSKPARVETAGNDIRKWLWILLPVLVTVGIITGIVIYGSMKKQNGKDITATEQEEITIQTRTVKDSITLTAVFWDQNGQESHLFKDCRHLSGEISEGTVEQAFSHNKKTLCRECINRVAEYKKYRELSRNYSFAGASKNLRKALEYCDKILAMRPDHQRTATLKQDIESELKSQGTKPAAPEKVITLPELGSLVIYPSDIKCQDKDEAMEMCRTLNSTKAFGYDKWQIPPKAELQLMYIHRHKIKGIKEKEQYLYASDDGARMVFDDSNETVNNNDPFYFRPVYSEKFARMQDTSLTAGSVSSAVILDTESKTIRDTVPKAVRDTVPKAVRDTVPKAVPDRKKTDSAKVIPLKLLDISECLSMISKTLNDSPTSFWESGNIYKGQKDDSGRNGLGVFYYKSSNDFYFGAFKNDLREGNGIYIKESDNNCKYYVGGWLSNKKNGKGVCYDNTGTLDYYGNFVNGTISGKHSTGHDQYKFTVINYSVENRYLGEIKGGKASGYGIYLHSNGDMWYGEWENGMRNGYGVEIKYDGSIVSGHWANDVYSSSEATP
jgi:serine/threonine protein kinase